MTSSLSSSPSSPRPDLSLREQLIEVLSAETNYIEDEELGAVFSEVAGADAILQAFTVTQKAPPAGEAVRFIEGESEEVGSSPIRFSYTSDGILEITYEPSWEAVARSFSAAPAGSMTETQKVNGAAGLGLYSVRLATVHTTDVVADSAEEAAEQALDGIPMGLTSLESAEVAVTLTMELNQ